MQLQGIPGQSFEAKIKEAYGYGLAAEQTALLAAGKPNDDTTYQQVRDAVRQAELATFSAFLGSVHIDHFVEVTMAGFYEVAQAVAPIMVCVNQATLDTYSGADFKAGMQQIDAKQAKAFVRQRRDTSEPSYDFSDLDRERRQQAFIASVIHQLKQAGTFTDIPKMESVLNAVSKNIVVDSGLNLIELSQQAGYCSRALPRGSLCLWPADMCGDRMGSWAAYSCTRSRPWLWSLRLRRGTLLLCPCLE